MLQLHVCLTRVSMVAVRCIVEPIVVVVIMERREETVIRVRALLHGQHLPFAWPCNKA